MMQDTHDSDYHVGMTTGDIGDTTAVHHVTSGPSCELESVCNDIINIINMTDLKLP